MGKVVLPMSIQVIFFFLCPVSVGPAKTWLTRGACDEPLEPSFKPFGLRPITQVLRIPFTVHVFRCSPRYRHAMVPFGFRL
jgi:hypothetical protein